ncbi:MAG: hypothetical protein R3181_05880 [Rubricoccaceae bacterium]|nr:hypothetical protein [Rubricoccaceae bacterium]
MRRRLLQTVEKADGVLGRLVYRSVGLVLGALTLGALSMLRGVVADGSLAGAERIGAVTVAVGAVLLFGAGTWYCFGKGRRLSDLD